MQTTLSKLTSPVQPLAAGTWLCLFAVLTFCLAGAAPAKAGGSSKLPIVVSQDAGTWGYFPAGGWDSGQSPLSSTFVVGANGDVFIGNQWGHDLLDISPSGTATTLATWPAPGGWNAGPAAIDGNGNLYLAADGYDSNIYKIPYNAATGTYAGFTAQPSAACQGGTLDTAACLYAANFGTSVWGSAQGGYTDMVFDGAGNLFVATSTAPGTNKNSIYECSVSCQAGSVAPALLYTDSNALGGLAVDPWDNVYFSDGANGTSQVTKLNELPLVSGSYAASPTVIASYTNSLTYGNGFAGVAADAHGTIYFVTNSDGIFAFPSTQSGGPNFAGLYMVATGGGYGITLDSKDNLYLVHYAGTVPSGDSNYAVDQYLINNLSLGSTTIGGTATTATANVIDNSGACTATPPTLTITAAEFGVATNEFTAAEGTGCSAALGSGNGTISPAPALVGAVTSATVTFNPAQAGVRSAALTTADAAAGTSGVAAVTGVGQGALANVDPGVETIYTPGFTAPAAMVSDPVGDVLVADSGAHAVYEIASGSNTLSATIGSGWSRPAGLAFDASGNLYVADGSADTIVEIPNTGNNAAYAPGTPVTLIASTTLINKAALNGPTGLVVGPRGTLYIADTGNKRVVTYNTVNGSLGTTQAIAANGLTTPAGVAVDSTGNLYVADSGAGEVFIVSAAGVVSPPLTVTGASAPAGVAVDASGSVLVADGTTGNVVRIPNVSGTLTGASAITVETIPSGASSLAMDALGDIDAASSSGKTAYAIQRTAASINLGAAADGVSNTGTVYLMNAGNEPATLANPDVTEPANTILTLTGAAANGCSPGSGPAGASCAFTAEFFPPAGSGDTGLYSGAAEINLSTPAEAIQVTISGTASVSSIQPQTITYNPALPVSGFIGQQIALAATATSGLTVTFSSATPGICTVSGTTATFIAAGSCTIDANQAGGPSNGQQWSAAPEVTTSIAITSATPAGVPALLMNQVTWLNETGSFTDGENPTGGNFAVTPNGEIFVGTSYSGNLVTVNAQTGATVNKISFAAGGITTDSAGNLYVSHLYNNVIYKVPYNATTQTYASFTDNPTPAPPACTGSDTAQCIFVTYPSSPAPPAPQNNGLKDIAFDAAGNFYMVTEPSEAGSGASYIFECNTSCQPAGTGTLLYSDTNAISEIAFDPWGNLFFTDANFLVAGASDEGSSGASSSGLYELAYNSATSSFAATATPLQTFTNSPAFSSTSAANYDNILASLAVNPTTGTIYFGTLYDGTYAIPNTQAGGPAVANEYAVASQGAKSLVYSNGNLYLVSASGSPSGSDTVGVLWLGDLSAGTGPVLGTPVTASASVVDNANGCGTTATLAFASSNPEFAANAGATCSSMGMGDATLLVPYHGASRYSATITFAPINQGVQTATLSVSDTANGGAGTATVSGTGIATPQTIAFTAPATTTFTYSPTLTIPLAVTTTGASNGTTNLMQFAIAGSSTGVGTISAPVLSGGTWSATLTVTQAGSFTINASQAGGLVNNVYYETSTQSIALTVNQAAQAIAFAPPASPVAYSPGLTVSLSATGGASGNQVAFTINSTCNGGTCGVGTISGGTLSVTQAGTFVINANQAGNADYLPAPQVQQTVVVTQATQTITFTPVTTPFHYIPSCPTISVCANIQIVATGGATDNLVALSPDPNNAVAFTILGSSTKGATTTTTIALVPSQTLSFPASLILDGSQQGNSNYSAATPAQLTVTVLAPLPAQTITFNNPGTQVAGPAGTPATLALTATASSALPVSYMSSTTSVCTVSGSTVSLLTAGTCSITAVQPGDNLNFAAALAVTQSFIVNAAGQKPAISLNLQLATLTVQSGTVGLTPLTVGSSNNFTGSVSFSCSGLPSGYTCTFNPNPLVITAGSSIPTQLAISGSSTTASIHHGSLPYFPATTLAVALCFLGFRKRSRWQLLVFALIALTGLGLFSGCGGSSSSSTPTPTTSTVTISATSTGLAGASANVTQTTTLTLTVD